MDATAWVAIAGIIGTLFAPVVGELVRRKSIRKERLLEQRLVAYEDLLRIGIRFVDNAMNLSSIPEADFTEPESDELNRLDGQIRLVASDNVAKLFKTFTQQVGKFNSDLFMARLKLNAARDSGDSDAHEGRAIQQRLELGRRADAIRDTYHEIEVAIRKDVQR